MATDRGRPKARLPRGFADRGPAEIRRVAQMTETIRAVYERWGFEPVETPLIEYADALGKFLPDQDRPNEGVFAFQDDDEQWLSLRYDLTAPLARLVASQYERLPKPYKSYRSGWVFRNEKPGPGRFRQFMQFDADIVGSASPLADAEICMMAADTMEALGFAGGEYVVRVSHRKLLDGALEAIQLNEENSRRRLIVLRAIDKLDKLGPEGVRLLLSSGRRDESGDFTEGAALNGEQADFILAILHSTVAIEGEAGGGAAYGEAAAFTPDPRFPFNHYISGLGSITAAEGISELSRIKSLVQAAGYTNISIKIDPAVVRGLEYYTGPVFEAELELDTLDDSGHPVRFGSVGGGGRYDGLVGRFRGENVPATGFSVGVSRLAAALAARDAARETPGPVVVTVMDRAEIGRTQALTAKLRAALNPPGAAPVPVEMYIGAAGMKAQLKYADRRNAPCVVIEGSDERARGVVQIKDLAAGKAAADSIGSREEWTAARPAQHEVGYDGNDVAAIAAAVRAILR